jgi:gliding motility-associated protein GldM
MAGYKETPRQKMIAMMYLVLTALLALNVSKQILDAFVVVNESMETTNENFSKKLESTYAKFKVQYQLNPNKVGPYFQKAQVAKKLSQDLAKYVDSLKTVMTMINENIPTFKEAQTFNLRDSKRKDNYDRSTNFFIGRSKDGSGGVAGTLKRRIEEYKKQMLDLVDPQFRNSIKIGLDTKGPYKDADGSSQNWEMHNFYRTIFAADVTILNKIKAEIYNAEFDVTNYLYASVTALDYKFDVIRAKVIPKSAYVFTGEDYQAEIVVGAYDTKADPDVRYVMGSDSLYEGSFKNATRIIGSNGVVNLKLPTGNVEGLKKFAGIIKIVNPLGDTMTFHFKDEFIVAKPALVISPSKMNVFYVGVDNPVEISVPGSPEKVLPSISVGKVRAEGNSWVVYDLPKNTKEAVITVNAVFSGKTKSMGTGTFRLKRVPDPIATVAGKHEGIISKSLLQASPFVIAEMPAGFDFQLQYLVTSFTFTTVISGDVVETKVQGNRFTPEIVKIITNAKKNQRMYVEDITVKGPDGERNISAANLKIQ